MRKTITAFSIALIFTFWLTGCGWKPEVSAVPLTAPWTAFNLPVKENAVVWKSDPNEFRAVHKDDKKTVAKSYTDALKAQGWAVEKFDEYGDRWYLDMKKGAERLHLEFYDFDNTGVLIEKK